MKRFFTLIVCLILVLSLAACGAEGEPSASESGSGSVIEPPAPSEPAPRSSPEPSSPSSVEAEAERWEPSAPEPPDDAPDPGVYAPAPGPGGSVRDRVEALAAYLEERLDPRDYADIQPFMGDGSRIDVLTPFPEAVKQAVEAYPGDAVEVQCDYVPFSKGQMQQAKDDLTHFLEEHPEIEVIERRNQVGLFSGYRISVREKSDKLTEFVEAYATPDIYEVVVGAVESPD